MSESTQFLSGVGRIVWGHPTKPQLVTDPDTKQPKLDQQGNKIYQFAFGLATPLAEFNAGTLPYLQAEAGKGFPNGVPGGFAWKYKTCDDIDPKGKRYGEREGCEGCAILTLSTTLKAPELYRQEGVNYFQISDTEIKTGDYVVVRINTKVNVATTPTRKSSLYVNPEMVLLIGQGEEIVPTVDPSEVFGGQSFALPAGAVAPTAAIPGQPLPGQPLPGQAVPGQAVPGQAPLPQAVAAPQPLPGAPVTPAVNPQPTAAPQVATTAPTAITYPTNVQPGVPGQAPLPGQPVAQPTAAPAYDFVQNAVKG